MPSSEPFFQHKKASLNSRAPQEKEGRPKPLLLNMEDQVWIESKWQKNILVHFRCCHLRFQGLTGERRYTKSPPKTRSSIFSSKPYNASQYVPSFSSKVVSNFYFLLTIFPKNTNPPHPRQLLCHRKSRYLEVRWLQGNCNRKTTAPPPRF